MGKKGYTMKNICLLLFVMSPVFAGQAGTRRSQGAKTGFKQQRPEMATTESNR